MEQERKAPGLSRDDLTPRQWFYLTVTQAPPEPLEILFGILLVVWGVWIMLPWFRAFDASPGIYYWLLRIMPDEFAWGWGSAMMGAAMLFGVYRERTQMRYWCAVLLASFWAGGVPIYLFSDWRSIAAVWYSVLAAAAWWISGRHRARLQARQDAKQNRQRHQQGNQQQRPQNEQAVPSKE